MSPATNSPILITSFAALKRAMQPGVTLTLVSVIEPDGKPSTLANPVGRTRTILTARGGSIQLTPAHASGDVATSSDWLFLGEASAWNYKTVNGQTQITKRMLGRDYTWNINAAEAV